MRSKNNLERLAMIKTKFKVELESGKRYRFRRTFQNIQAGAVLRFGSTSSYNLSPYEEGEKGISFLFYGVDSGGGPDISVLHEEVADFLSILEPVDYYSVEKNVLELKDKEGNLIQRREFSDTIEQVYFEDHYCFVLLKNETFTNSNRGFFIFDQQLTLLKYVDLNHLLRKEGIRWLDVRKKFIDALSNDYPNHIYVDKNTFEVIGSYSIKE